MPTDFVGPISTFDGIFNQTVAFYMIRYDKQGQLLSPQSLDHLMAHVVKEKITDVLFYSHGWNNDFPTAKARYEAFLTGISDTAKAYPHVLRPEVKPVFVGVIWPSTILVWPKDQAPDILATSETEDFGEMLALLPPETRAEVALALKDGKAVDNSLARRVAEDLAMTLPNSEDEVDSTPYSAQDLLEAWTAVKNSEAGTAPPAGGFSDFGAPAPDGDVAMAGVFRFDPRMILRAATVLKMKDRAGVVGKNGVADTLKRLLQETDARLHLFGHSYGAKVVTAGLLHAGAARKAQSVTLFQPAMNHQAFSPDVNGQPGACRPVLSRVERPVMATYSNKDVPLYRVFHLVCRRAKDLTEIAAAGAVSRYAALGGYGPQTLAPGESAIIALPDVGAAFAPQPGAVRLLGLNGANGIDGHGCVNNARTWWAALNQLR